MAAPTITAIYPSNSATSVPVGATIKITFSTGIDVSTVKNSVVLYGKDNDFISGPETATWFKKDGTNRDFLKSPGFQGLVKCDYELVYVDSAGDTVSLSPEDLTDETGGPYTHQLLLKPQTILYPNVTYYLYIIGEEVEGTDKGLSCRTVYEVDSSGATSTTAETIIYGGYTKSGTDVVNIEITKAGNIGTAEFKYWYDSEGVSAATTGRVTSRRFRRLDDGLQVRFAGSSFALGDTYTANLYPREYLASSYTSSFTTSSADITEVPSTASTSVIGLTSSTTSEPLTVKSITPADGATHQKFSSKQITIEFSATLDSGTVTDDTVTVLAYPISGIINTADEEKELFKKLTVEENKIIIDL